MIFSPGTCKDKSVMVSGSTLLLSKALGATIDLKKQWKYNNVFLEMPIP